MKNRFSTGLAVALLAALPACDSSRADDSPSAYDVEPTNESAPPVTPSPGANGASGAAGGGGIGEPPPEVEREDTYRAPVVTGRYVWSANPESGRVAVIDAQSFEIRGGEAGNGPSVVAGLQGAATPRALVINSGASDASLLELTDTGVGARHVPLHQGADSWSLSPDGRVAIAWTDSRKAERLDATDGLQDITVLELSDSGAPVATRLSVGYRPNAIVFDAQSRRAFAVTEDGISIVDLAPGAVRLAQLVSLPSTRRAQPDVAITADGTRALARLEGDQNLYDVDLVSGQTRAIPLGGVITDLDLSADGSRAVAVIRARPLAGDADAGAPNADAGLSDAGLSDASASGDDPAPAPGSVSEAVFIAVPAGLTDASERRTASVPNGNFGSVALSPDGSRAVLFSTALGTGVVTLIGPDLEQRSVDLIAPVRAVFVSADSAFALALQDPPAGSVKKGAFSVLSLAAVRAPKRVATDAPAELVALDESSPERAIVTVSDASTGLYGAYFVRMPSLQVDFIPLPSRPLSSGVVAAAGQGFVSQRHPEGRITFISLETGVSRVITGFELSAKVVNE